MAEIGYIFGPVPSRRLGYSLGIDSIPFKTCTLNCIYCQLGRTAQTTLLRKEYLKLEEIIKEVKIALSSGKTIDYLTFSGSGEPTLNSKIGEMIRKIKGFTSIPIAVITNGTLLSLKEVRDDLKFADLVIPSLDAATQKTFEKINRPFPSLRIEEIIQGMIEFRKIFPGKLYLEIMLVREINDSPQELHLLKEAIKKINPDKVQINTPVRPPAEAWIRTVEREQLEKIKELLGEKAEIIAEFKRKETHAYLKNIEEEIYALLLRRPVTLQEISATLGLLHINEVVKYLEILEKADKVKAEEYAGKKYFQGKE